MPYLVRKISLSKWQPKNGVAEDEIPADALSADLRTQKNALSFWSIESPENVDEIGKVALALVTNSERVDRMDLTWVKKSSLETVGIRVDKTEGKTPVVCLKNLHVDIACLDTNRCCTVARAISESITEKMVKRFKKDTLLGLIDKAIDEGLLGLEDLQDKVRREIEKFRLSKD